MIRVKMTIFVGFYLVFILPLCAGQSPYGFRCTLRRSCQAFAGYMPQKETTYESIAALFGVNSIYDLYGANGINETTPTSTKVTANTTVRVPFACACNNGTGISSKGPVYLLKEGDSLEKIAGETFSGLVTAQQIAAANSIVNASSVVKPGERVSIPLPCSCGTEEVEEPVHLAHVVREKTSLAEISSMYLVSQASLLSLNNVSDHSSLAAGQLLDVPLQACGSSWIRAISPDAGLFVPDGSYALTAHNSIKCSCNFPGVELFCMPSSDTVKNKSLGGIIPTCPGGPSHRYGLDFGVFYVAECSITRCVYAGYDERMIWTATITQRYNDCDDTPDSSVGGGSLAWSFRLSFCLTILVFFLGF
ncbi:chitin elicitor-binding protein-like [Wolffia australiana]